MRRRRQVVAAPYARHAAEIPERALQTAHERLERLGERQADPAPLAEAQHELEKQVREDLAGDGDSELAGVREVERAFASRLVLLLEHHLLARPVERAPLMDVTLQGA